MTWSYGGDPAFSTRDFVRYRIGDTDTTDQLLSNEELDYEITTHVSGLKAAVHACRAIVAKLSRHADKSDSGISVKSSQKYEHYKRLLAELELELATTAIVPYAGGISIADKRTNEQDTDRVKPAFTRTLHDVPPGTSNTTLTNSDDWSQ